MERTVVRCGLDGGRDGARARSGADGHETTRL